MQFSKFVISLSFLLLLMGSETIFSAAMKKESDEYSDALEKNAIMLLHNNFAKIEDEKIQGNIEEALGDMSDLITKFKVYFDHTFAEYMEEISQFEETCRFLNFKQFLQLRNSIINFSKNINQYKKQLCELDNKLFLFDSAFNNAALVDQIPQFNFEGRKKYRRFAGIFTEIADNFFSFELLKAVIVIEKFIELASSKKNISYKQILGLKKKLINICNPLLDKIVKTVPTINQY